MVRRRKLLLTAVVLIAAAGLVLIFTNDIKRRFFSPTETNVEPGISRQDLPSEPQTIAENLSVPWSIAFLPNGDMLVTERPGRLLRIGDNRQTYEIEGVAHTSEGGLLGLTLHPDFEQNRRLYLYMTTRSSDGLTNRIESYRYENDKLSQRRLVLAGIPGAANHDGGAIAFGPDRHLYATTGDAGTESLAQERNSLAGKILRITDDGQVPADNPFGNAVYSLGHRNPQGLAWDSQGRLWSSEHGRSGLRSGYDEINLIQKGGNYGWPEIEGDETMSGMISPVLHSGADDTWAPASLAYLDGSLYFGGLRGQSLYRAEIKADRLTSLKANFTSEYGRIRTVTVGPDGWLYFSTSNTDGRGNPRKNDDKIIKFNPSS